MVGKLGNKANLRSFGLDLKVRQNGYTFHLEQNPPYNFFRMCNQFYIGLYVNAMNQALWNRMVKSGYPENSWP